MARYGPGIEEDEDVEKDEESASIFTTGGEVRPSDDIPEEAKAAAEESRLIDDIKRKHQAAKAGSELWRYHARRAYNYYENDQRPPEIRDDEDAFYLILNLIRNRTDTKVGTLVAAKPRAEMSARGIEDEEISAAFRDLTEFSFDKTDLDGNLHAAVADMVKVGLGILEEVISDEEVQYTTHGEVIGDVQTYHRSSLEFFIDPTNRSFNLNGPRGAHYFTIEEEVPTEEVLMRYPRKAWLISDNRGSQSRGTTTKDATYTDDFDGNAHTDAGDDTSESPKGRQLAEPSKTLVTIWYKKRIDEPHVWARDPKTGAWDLALDEAGAPIDVDDIGDDDPNFWTEVRVRRVWWTAAIVDDVLLYNYKSPYHHGSHPYAFFVGTLHHDEATPYGEIHRLIDAQDLFNKVNSLVIDNAARNNNAGWTVEEGALDEEMMQALEERGSDPGFILKTRPGAVSSGAVKRLEPGQLSTALYTIQADIRVLFDELSSLYQTQRGGMPYDTSGKAIIALQQAGDTAMVGLQRNIETGLTTLGKKRLSNIQQFWTIEKAWRVTDKLKDAAYHYVTQLQYSPKEEQNTLQLWKLEDGDPREGTPAQAKRLLEDFTATYYDVKITMGTGHERSREQRLEEARAVVEVTGGVPSAVRNLLSELEVPDKQEILREMKERDQLAQMAKGMEESGVQPQMLQDLGPLMADPVLSQILGMVAQNPQLLLKAASESPTFMKYAQQAPLQQAQPARRAA